MCYHSSNSSGNCHDLHFCKEVQKNLLPGKSATPMANNDESDSGRDRRSWQRERRRSESPRPKRRPGVSIPPHRREDGARNDVGRESRRHRSRSAHRPSGHREDRDLRHSIQASRDRDRDAHSPAIRANGRPADVSNRRDSSSSVVSIPYEPAPIDGGGGGQQPDSRPRQHGREVPDAPREGGPPREGNRPHKEESRPVTPPTPGKSDTLQGRTRGNNSAPAATNQSSQGPAAQGQTRRRASAGWERFLKTSSHQL